MQPFIAPFHPFANGGTGRLHRLQTVGRSSTFPSLRIDPIAVGRLADGSVTQRLACHIMAPHWWLADWTSRSVRPPFVDGRLSLLSYLALPNVPRGTLGSAKSPRYYRLMTVGASPTPMLGADHLRSMFGADHLLDLARFANRGNSFRDFACQRTVHAVGRRR